MPIHLEIEDDRPLGSRMIGLGDRELSADSEVKDDSCQRGSQAHNILESQVKLARIKLNR